MLWKFVGFDLLIPDLHLLQELDDLDVICLLVGLGPRLFLGPKIFKSKLLNLFVRFQV